MALILYDQGMVEPKLYELEMEKQVVEVEEERQLVSVVMVVAEEGQVLEVEQLA